MKKDAIEFTQPLYKKIALLSSVVIFCGGLIVSVSQSPELFQLAEFWPWLFFITLIILGSTIFNSVEFFLMGQVLNQHYSFLSALKISIIASAANLLPFPGGFMAKTAALKAGGGTIKQGVMVNLLFSFIWVGMAFTMAGISLVSLQVHSWLGVILFAGGFISILGIWITGVWRYKISLPLLLKASALRLFSLLLYSIMTYSSLRALGVDVVIIESAVFSLASVLGATFSVVPAGLGLRELASSIVATIINIDPYYAFLAAALSRFITMCLLMPFALILGLKRE